MSHSHEQPVKLLMSYDMREGVGQEYYQFVLGRYIPAMQALGLQMVEAWQTQYGNGPDRLVGFLARDEQIIHDLFKNESWQALNHQLLEFVTNFEYKVIPYREGFQI
jgi:hypothetical protein